MLPDDPRSSRESGGEPSGEPGGRVYDIFSARKASVQPWPAMRASESLYRMGLSIFLVSLGVMFFAAVVAYVITRQNQPTWVSGGVPHGLWVSTTLLAMLTIAMRRARHHVTRNRRTLGQRALYLAVFFAIAFVLAQSFSWVSIHQTAHLSRTLYAATFYMLTGLHALHVVGGLVPLLYVAYRNHQGRYSSSRSRTIRLVTTYWDFLAVVWVVLLATLVIGS